MTLQEILKSQGLNDEQVEAIVGEMKQNKIFTASEENLDIRYAKLKEDHDSLTTQHGEATQLIEQFKAGAKDNEVLQGKITAYESQIATLQGELDAARLDSAMDRVLTEAGAKADDFDYLKFLWKQKGEVTLDENGKIKGADDAVAALKTQRPGQFESAVTDKKIEVHKLPGQDDGAKRITKEEFSKMGYDSRVKLKEENPELYAQMTK